MTSLLSAGAIIVGVLIALANWYSVYASYRYDRRVSAVPLLGGLLLVIGLAGFPDTRPYAWLGFVFDYGTIMIALAVPVLVADAWSTAPFNRLHHFVSDASGRHDDIRLYKGGKFAIRRDYDPPEPCNEHGALAVTQNFTGKWRAIPGGFVLEDYAEERTLTIREDDGVYRTRETHYPADRAYPVDRFDALELKKL